MNKIAIIGAGEQGRQALQILFAQNIFSVVGFYDDFAKDEFEKYEILGKISDVKNHYSKSIFDYIFIAIGYKHLKFKESLMKEIKNIPLASIIHPTAFIENSATIETGCLIYPNAYIGPNTTIKSCSIINIGCILSHDIQIGTCSFLSVGATIGGFSRIGNRSFIGIGTTIIDHIQIADDITVGAGSVVVKNLSEKGLYLGIPAKQYHHENKF